MIENWKPVPEFPAHYAVSDHGKVKRTLPGPHTHVGLILRPKIDRYGYKQVVLNVYPSRYFRSVHSLVLAAFGPPKPSASHTSDHIDRNKLNNHISNLRWATPKLQRANAEQSIPLGSDRPESKLTEQAVAEMRRIRRERKATYYELGGMYGVSFQTAHLAIVGKTWKHVTEPPVPGAPAP